MSIKQIKSCEICYNKKLKLVINLGFQPLCDDLKQIGHNKKNKLYPIKIYFCKNCLTAYQSVSVNKKELFPKNYHYRAKNTKDVLNGMKELVLSCKKISKNLKNKKVLDIGCNDGSLLNFFKKEKCITYGIEPTNAFKDAKKLGHKVTNDWFDEKSAKKFKIKNGLPDIITFTNVFAHIENLKQLLKSVKIIMGPKTILIIENHYLGEVIKKKQFDTFYHEHPRTYSLTSFVKISEKLNSTLLKVQFIKRYNGNVRVFIQKNNKKNNKKITKKIKKDIFIKKDILKMQAHIKKWKASKLKLFNKLKKNYGPLPAKSFPGRSTIPLKILNLDNTYISRVYEKPNSLKVGNYVPGTNIPIISDNDFKKNKENNSKIIINLSWHISKEIKNYLKKNLKFKGRVIDIISINDFK
tara:strand:- start:349 stop:1578 length:1230 start_codon:yes stop_codon:yes gene_type:complete